MKIPQQMRATCLACLSLLIAMITSGCSIFAKHYEVTEPTCPALEAAYDSPPPFVDSLQPELKWKDVKEPGQTYDLAIWSKRDETNTYVVVPLPVGVVVNKSTTWGQLIYYVENLTNNWHKVRQPLAAGNPYNWSVRIREGSKVGTWGAYNQRQPFVGPHKNTPFAFRTPGQ
jgi:hypothetical protein